MMPRWIRRLRGRLRYRRFQVDLREEIEAHRAMAEDEWVARGAPPPVAKAAATRQLGNVALALESARAEWIPAWCEWILQDVRYARRSLARQPVFAVVVIATLGLGLGAVTTMFTVARAVFVRPLPYRAAERLVSIAEPDRQAVAGGPTVASADFEEWAGQASAFSQIAAYGGLDERGVSHVNLFLSTDGEAARLKGLYVWGGDLFGVLGVSPMLGRTWAASAFKNHEEDGVVLSYDCWRSTFASDTGIIGRAIALSGTKRPVIGVMPRGFFFPDTSIDVYLLDSTMTPNRDWHDLSVIARLARGVSLEHARAEMAVVGAHLQREHPATNATLSTRVDSWHATLASSVRPAIVLLSWATGLFFAIVCSNVAHLQLSRMTSRVQEFNLRKALGAGRRRLIWQLVTESLVLSSAGGLLGWLLTIAAQVALNRYAAGALPFYVALRLDQRVVLFATALVLAAPVLFGLAPAVFSTRPTNLDTRGGSLLRASRRMRNGMVMAEVALSVVLVVCAGLFIHSLLRLDAADVGFRPDGTLTFRVDLDPFAPSGVRSSQYAQIESHLVEDSGIVDAGATNRPILGGGSGGKADVTILGRVRPLRLEIVTHGYLSAMQTPLVRGRLPSGVDDGGGHLWVVVNTAFERAYFPDGNVLGQQIQLGRRGDATIVGVVADMKQERVDHAAEPAAFVSAAQFQAGGGMTFVMRGVGGRSVLLTKAQQAVHAVNPSVPLLDVASLDELMASSTNDRRIRTWLLSLAAVAALVLAGLGIYGVLAYSVTQRTAELGVRLALGATAPRVFASVVWEGLRPVIAGTAVGFALAWMAAQAIRSQLFGVPPFDPATYVLTASSLGAIAVCACAVPALRSIRVNPVDSLKRT
jgi:predicted permease